MLFTSLLKNYFLAKHVPNSILIWILKFSKESIFCSLLGKLFHNLGPWYVILLLYFSFWGLRTVISFFLLVSYGFDIFCVCS